VKLGRIFLLQLIDLSTTVQALHHKIGILHEAQRDISWWQQFLVSWNGLSMVQEGAIEASSIQFFSDTSFAGMGGFFAGRWLSVPFTGDVYANITYLEMLAVKACVLTWGNTLANRQI